MNHLLPLKKALALIAQFPLATAILVVATAQSGVLDIVRTLFPLSGAPAIGVSIISALLALFVGAYTIRWAGTRLMNTQEHPTASFAIVARKFGAFVVTTIIALFANILSVIGLLAIVFIPTEPLFALPGIILLIPGLLIATLLMFTNQAVILSDKHFFSALRESVRLVRPRFWYTALRVIALYALIGVPVFLIGKGFELVVLGAIPMLAVNTVLSSGASVIITFAITALFIDIKQQSVVSSD